MARGWGTDEDHRDTQGEARPADPRPEAARRAEAGRTRQKQLLQQQRERILSERTSNPHRRAALQAALEQVEAAMRALDETAT